MAIIDINPETKDKTQALIDCTVRLIDKDNTAFDYKIDQGIGFEGDRAAHPYIKNYLGSLDVVDEQKILILNKDGSERLGPINIPSGKLPVFRLRTRGLGKAGVTKFIIVGLVDKESQELHFLDIHGKENVETSPQSTGLYGQIGLLPEELERL